MKPTLADKWYCFGMEWPCRHTGERNLNVIRKSYRNLDEWKTRASIIRQGILKGAQLFPLPRKTPLNAQIHSRRELNGYSVENVFFESVPGFFVSGNLYRPLAPAANHSVPAILTPHGHFKNPRIRPEQQHFNATLARMGIISFVYDMVGFTENTQVPHESTYTLMFQLWNSLRAVDFILSLDGVDPTRIGMTGASGGGTQTVMCTAVEDRITACAPMIMVSSGFYGRDICEDQMPIHKGKNPYYATNNAEIAALAAPRPQLIVSDGKDWTRLFPYRELPFMKSVYHLHEAENRLENVHLPDEGHDMGPSKRQPVYRFFAKIFGLNISHMLTSAGLIDESPVKILSDADLQVYTTELPRPSYALKDGTEVYQSLCALKDYKNVL